MQGTAARIAAALIAGLALGPSAAQAGTYGDLDLEWTGTTTNFTEYPSRKSQTTYSPCSGSEQLLGIGGYVLESAPTVPTVSEFKVGRAYVVGYSPVDEFGAPNPESNRQVADHLFKTDRDIIMGESTLCALSAGASYESKDFTAKGRGRTAAEVKCTGGATPVSGGVRAAGPVKSTRMVISRPVDGPDADPGFDDAWRVSVDNLKRKARDATVYAICSDADGYVLHKAAMNFGPEERARLDLDCPTGEYAIGGGVSSNIAPRKVAVVASRHGTGPTPDRWIVELDNLSQEVGRAAAYVFCHT